MRLSTFIGISTVTLIISIPAFVAAQPTATAPAEQTAAGVPPPPPDYSPTIADLMTFGVQPRHTKIGMALHEQNWAYLAYETNELKNVLNRIVRAVPRISGKFDTAAMFQSTITPSLQDLAAALKAQDLAKSTAAYAAVTASCNACHQAVMHGAIVIKLPQNDAYPDQDFHPPGTP